MRAAILFSGHTRTFHQTYPTFKWQVGRHFPNATYVYSTVKDNDFNALIESKFFEHCGPAAWRIQAFDEQPSFTFTKEWVKKQPFTHEPYPISVHPEAIMRQLWQLEQAYKLYIENTEEKDFADVFIRARPDSWWMQFPYSNADFTLQDYLIRGASIQGTAKTCWTPWWGRFGGVNDRFAIMGRDAADAYFFTYSRVDKLRKAGCPLHPESLVKASLEDVGITIYDNLQASFATFKTDGTFRLPEVSNDDFAHLLI